MQRTAASGSAVRPAVTKMQDATTRHVPGQGNSTSMHLMCTRVGLTSSNEEQEPGHDVDEPGNVADRLAPAVQCEGP